MEFLTLKNNTPKFTSRVKMNHSTAMDLNKYLKNYPEVKRNFLKQLDEFKHNGDDNIIELSFHQKLDQSQMFKQMKSILGMRVIENHNNTKKLSVLKQGDPIVEKNKYLLLDDMKHVFDVETGKKLKTEYVDDIFAVNYESVNLKKWYAELKNKMANIPEDAENFFKYCD